MNFLGDDNTLLMILLQGLSDVKVKEALAVIKRIKKGIGGRCQRYKG